MMKTAMEELAGIPGSVSKEAARIRWLTTDKPTPPGGKAVGDVVDAMITAGGGVVQGWYTASVGDGNLRACVSREPAGKNGKMLWHISVSHRERMPTWDEMKMAAYRLVPADVPLILIFPRRSTPKGKYTNVFEYCLHLYEADGEIDR